MGMIWSSVRPWSTEWIGEGHNGHLFCIMGGKEIISGHGNLIEVECTEVKQTWREYLVSLDVVML
jgi:hypothetical protein